MRLIGLEPTRSKPLDPKSSASTNFATSAFASAKVQQKNELKEEIWKKDRNCFLFPRNNANFANKERE